jgi:hypothetical protein
MAKQRLSRELEPTELPQHLGEALPEAATVPQPSPESKATAGGAEHKAGEEEYYEDPPTRSEVAPTREDPPRGQREDPPPGTQASGGQ